MHLNRSFGKLTAILLPFILTGCSRSPSIIAPASTSAKAITDLMWGFSGVAGLGFVIVEAILIYTLFRFRHKDSTQLVKATLPKQIEGNRLLEVAWTIIPAILLLTIFIFTVSTLWAIKVRPSQVPPDTQVVNINVIGHQWWWEFRYPDLDITTAQELHVPVDSLVFITVDSADVIHSFWVPQMGGKIDAIHGHLNQSWFQPTHIGRYVGECSEYCGTEHAHMRLDLVVESPEDYTTWVRQQQSPIPMLTGEAAEGKELFLNGMCTACHTINGTEAEGILGPNLTHLGSRQDIAGAVLTNTPENLSKWLENPDSVKPGVKMPKPDNSDAERELLVMFLQSLK